MTDYSILGTTLVYGVFNVHICVMIKHDWRGTWMYC